MAQFQLDTSGVVRLNPRNGSPLNFSDLDAFTQGYIEALFFTNQSCIPMVEFHSEESQSRIREGQADGDLPNDAGFSDLHPDALASIIRECAEFQETAAGLLELAYQGDYDATQAGRDFWLTRNGHGAGFWDREALKLDDRERWREAGSPRVGEAGWAEYKVAQTATLGDQLSAVARHREVNPYFSEPDAASPTGYGFVRLD